MNAEANFDPVQAEQFQEGMLRARERMQKELEEKALEYQEMEDKVSLTVWYEPISVNNRAGLCINPKNKNLCGE